MEAQILAEARRLAADDKLNGVVGTVAELIHVPRELETAIDDPHGRSLGLTPAAPRPAAPPPWYHQPGIYQCPRTRAQRQLLAAFQQ
mgnify:CR=1 FL=1